LKPHLRYFLLFFVLSAGIFSQIQAQLPHPGTLNRNVVERHVIGSAGDKIDTRDSDPRRPVNTVFPAPENSTHWLIEFTIGEVFIESLQGSKRRLTQGFNQEFLRDEQGRIRISPHVFSILDQEDIKEHFSVFPNPFVNNLSVKWTFEEDLNLLFEVYSLDGRRVFSTRQNSASSQLLIQLNNLKPQTYILRVSDPSRGFLETHKIVKL
jgi:hypothetical protein